MNQESNKQRTFRAPLVISLPPRDWGSVLESGHVRPRQGTEICNFGASSPLILGEVSPVDFFPFSPGFLFDLVRKSPQNTENIARFPGAEESAESCHVSGCHVFSVLIEDVAPFCSASSHLVVRLLHPWEVEPSTCWSFTQCPEVRDSQAL